MPAFLFVYGTLMSSAASACGRAQRERLQASAILLGPATMRARLYDLGSYPGLVTSADPGDIVHGEVLRLEDPESVLPWLDAYEGIVPGAPGNEYERIMAEARLAGGETVTAWVYVCRHAESAGRRVADGRWRPRI